MSIYLVVRWLCANLVIVGAELLTWVPFRLREREREYDLLFPLPWSNWLGALVGEDK